MFNILTLLEYDIHWWEQQPRQATNSKVDDHRDEEVCNLATARGTEEWMLICQYDVATSTSANTSPTVYWRHGVMMLCSTQIWRSSNIHNPVNGKSPLMTSHLSQLQI